MHLSPILLFGVTLLLATFAFALWKGSLAERIGASMNAAAGFVVIALDQILPPDLRSIAQLVIDAGLAAGFLFLAIRWASLWLGAAMILQAVQFSLHAYYMVTETPTAGDWMFARINNADTTLINLVIIGATVVAIRKRMADRREAARKAAVATPEPSAAG